MGKTINVILIHFCDTFECMKLQLTHYTVHFKAFKLKHISIFWSFESGKQKYQCWMTLLSVLSTNWYKYSSSDPTLSFSSILPITILLSNILFIAFFFSCACALACVKQHYIHMSKTSNQTLLKWREGAKVVPACWHCIKCQGSKQGGPLGQ